MPPKLLLTSALVAACAAAAPHTSFVDASRADLIQAVPELSTLDFATDQRALGPLLLAAGTQWEDMLDSVAGVSMAEDIHEMRFDPEQILWKDHRDRFRYVIETDPLAEFRTDTQGKRAPAIPNNPFLVAGQFVRMLSVLSPENQNQSRFRILGGIAERGGRTIVVAFAARDGSRQGLIWMDQTTKRVVRFRTDFLQHPKGTEFESFTRDVRFAQVNFPPDVSLWLPSYATVHLRFAGGELHSVHRLSDYRTDALKAAAGAVVGPMSHEDDPYEAMLEGLADLQAGKPKDAIAPLRVAAAQLPKRFEPVYYLGLTLYATRDAAGAEQEFREAVKRSPGSAAAHNEIGALLFVRGDRAGALVEFREAARLAPANAQIRANLERASKQPASVAGRSETAASASEAATIQVNVRQVLVPVVVTDKRGQHVTGLTQSDFQVLEDGIEQKITSFVSERVDVLTEHGPDGPGRATDRTAQPTPAGARCTYLICLDAMHASFKSFVQARKALKKLFGAERAADSQYVLLAVGRTTDVLDGPTSDPSKVLATLDGSDFQKTFSKSLKISSQAVLSDFENELKAVREACDRNDPSCEVRMNALPLRASAIEEYERFATTQFLRQFRSVVERMAQIQGRRMLILISDGFVLAPGEIPFRLLAAYFPNLRSTRSLERIQDEIEPIFKLAEKVNVPIYTIDARGLYAPPAFDASRGNVSTYFAPNIDRALSGIASDEGATLLEIASATGGTAFHDRNDLLAGLQRAFADGREYYMLSYTPSNETQDGKFRRIEVKVRNRGVVVSAKRGYWATAQ